MAICASDVEEGLITIAGMGVGQESHLNWIPERFENHIERDLFDLSQIPEILEDCVAPRQTVEEKDIQLKRLVFLAGIRASLLFASFPDHDLTSSPNPGEGAEALFQEGLFLKILSRLIGGNSPHCLDMLKKLIANGSSSLRNCVRAHKIMSFGSDLGHSMVRISGFIEMVKRAATGPHHEMITEVLDILVEKCEPATRERPNDSLTGGAFQTAHSPSGHSARHQSCENQFRRERADFSPHGSMAQR